MEIKGVCILLMNEDLSYNKFVSEILKNYSCQVLHSGDPSSVLNAIDKIKDGLGLVLTNAYMSKPGGDSVVQYIQNNINLPVARMDHDKSLMLPNGRTPSFTAYVINGLRREEIAKLRDLALQNAKGKMAANNQDENTQVQRATMVIDTIDNKDCPTVSETGSNNRKGHADKDEHGDDESHIQKKRRVHWTREMHKKFVEAIEIIGRDRAVPKKILEVMNIPGLTREHVASHLQKHRESMKREISQGPGYANSEIASGFRNANREKARVSLYASRANEFKLLPSNSRASFIAARNSYFAQRSYQMPPYQQKPFVSHALNCQCVNPQNRFSTTGRSCFTNNNLPDGNFRIYSPQTKNAFVSVNGNAPNQTVGHKCVGLQFTNEGYEIQFGENGFCQIQFPNYDQQNEKQVQTSITPRDISLEQHVVPPYGTNGDEKTVPAQFHNDSLKDLLINFEHETVDDPSTLVSDENPLSPLLNNDTSTSIEGVSEQHFSQSLETNDFIEQQEIDHVQQNGTGNALSDFDWNEFYHSLFGEY